MTCAFENSHENLCNHIQHTVLLNDNVRESCERQFASIKRSPLTLEQTLLVQFISSTSPAIPPTAFGTIKHNPETQHTLIKELVGTQNYCDSYSTIRVW